MAGLFAPIIRYAYPVAKAQVSPKQKVGQKSALTPAGEALYFDYEEAPAVLILLKDGTPKSFYLACTHFGCITKWQVKDQIFFCPCHSGEFAPDGKVLSGPPPKPLVELKVTVRRGYPLRRRDGLSLLWVLPPASSPISTAATVYASRWSIN